MTAQIPYSTCLCRRNDFQPSKTASSAAAAAAAAQVESTEGEESMFSVQFERHKGPSRSMSSISTFFCPFALVLLLRQQRIGCCCCGRVGAGVGSSQEDDTAVFSPVLQYVVTVKRFGVSGRISRGKGWKKMGLREFACTIALFCRLINAIGGEVFVLRRTWSKTPYPAPDETGCPICERLSAPWA